MKKITFKNKFFIIFAILLGILVGCGGNSNSSQKSSQSQASSQSQSEEKLTVVGNDLAKAEIVFRNTCSACHGKTGRGDGAASKGLTPPPRNLTSAEWQNSVDDAYIAQIIQYGGGAVGKSLAMPSNPAIGTDKKLLEDLVAYVRSLKEE